MSSLEHINNNKINKSTHLSVQSLVMELKYSGRDNISRDKSKSLILSEKLASLQCKHCTENERRANLNRSTENRHVKTQRKAVSVTNTRPPNTSKAREREVGWGMGGKLRYVSELRLQCELPVYGSATSERTVKNTLAVRFNNDSACPHL